MITFAKYEIVRTFRNRRFFIFSIGFPVVLYFTIAGPNRNEHNFANSGLPAALYYMVGLTAFGTINLSTAAPTTMVRIFLTGSGSFGGAPDVMLGRTIVYPAPPPLAQNRNLAAGCPGQRMQQVAALIQVSQRQLLWAE